MESGRETGNEGKSERGNKGRGEQRGEKVYLEGTQRDRGTFLLSKQRKVVYEYIYKYVFLNEMCVATVCITVIYSFLDTYM